MLINRDETERNWVRVMRSRITGYLCLYFVIPPIPPSLSLLFAHFFMSFAIINIRNITLCLRQEQKKTATNSSTFPQITLTDIFCLKFDFKTFYSTPYSMALGTKFGGQFQYNKFYVDFCVHLQRSKNYRISKYVWNGWRDGFTTKISQMIQIVYNGL